MSLMINRGKELIRINPENRNEIQYSTNSGSNWYSRGRESYTFEDLTDNGKEILATTSNGLKCSTNEGSNWYSR